MNIGLSLHTQRQLPGEILSPSNQNIPCNICSITHHADFFAICVVRNEHDMNNTICGWCVLIWWIKKNDFLSFYNWLVSDSKFFPSLSTIAAYILRIFLLHSLLYYHSQTALSSSYLRIPCTRTWVSGDDNSSCYSKMRYWLPSTSWYLTQLLMALHIIIY